MIFHNVVEFDIELKSELPTKDLVILSQAFNEEIREQFSQIPEVIQSSVKGTVTKL